MRSQTPLTLQLEVTPEIMQHCSKYNIHESINPTKFSWDNNGDWCYKSLSDTLSVHQQVKDVKKSWSKNALLPQQLHTHFSMERYYLDNLWSHSMFSSRLIPPLVHQKTRTQTLITSYINYPQIPNPHFRLNFEGNLN